MQQTLFPEPFVVNAPRRQQTLFAPHACFAEEDSEQALAGADGKRAAELLAGAKDESTRAFADACESAVRRLLASPDPFGEGVLFNDEELKAIAATLSRGIATADLMGRVRVRRRAERFAAAEGFAEGFAEGADHDPFDVFADPIPSLAPESAVEYFRRLVPTLAPGAVRYGPRLDRHAFTLAVASDQVILDRVKAAILRALTEGGSGTPEVQEILDAAGVSHRNPQYAELVVRTNVLDALNEGQTAELAEPGMREAFPVWQYDGIRDGRQGKDHEPKFDKYYPSAASFAEVRGPRVFNCRCGHSPIHRALWAQLQRDGARAEESW